MRIMEPVYRLLVIICLLIDKTISILIYELEVPMAIRAGDNVLLACHYDMQGDVLYSIKWYKGRREFYRYTLKENPAKKVFKLPGMNIDLTRSNASHVLITSVVAANTGKYSCEVSADAPSFHTQIMFKEMTVVDVPEQRPSIVGLNLKYAEGDLLRANCTSANSRPAVNLTWTINDKPVPPSQIYHVKPVRDEHTNLQTTTAGIHFLVSGSQHFVNGKLKLKCTSRIYDVYLQTVERIIEGGGATVSATVDSLSASGAQDASGSLTGHNNNLNVYNNSVYNNNLNNNLFNNNVNMFQSSDSLHDFETYGGASVGNKNEAYRTPIEADMSAAMRLTSLPCWTLLLIMYQLWASSASS